MSRILDFLENYTSTSTKNAYRTGIKKFLQFIFNLSNKELGKDVELEKLADEYFNSKRDFERDLVDFAVYLSKNNVPPKSAGVYLAAVKEWFIFNGIELSQRVLKEIKHKKPKGGVKTVQEELSKEMLKTILNHCDIRRKCLFMFLATTGCRISEALSIELDDLRLDLDPAEVIIRETKTGEVRIVFLTEEMKEVLQQWLKVREKFLYESYKRTENFRKVGKTQINLNDKRVFPFHKVTVEEWWIEVLEKTGYLRRDKVTGRATITLHSLRKYFRTQLVKAEIPYELIDAFMGHNRQSLQQIYTKFPKDEVVKIWKEKAEPALTIFGVDIEVIRRKEEELRKREEELQRKMNEIEERVQKRIEQESVVVKNLIEQLMTEKMLLQQRIRELEEENEKLKAKIEEIEERIEKLREIAVLFAFKNVTIPFAKTSDEVIDEIRKIDPNLIV